MRMEEDMNHSKGFKGLRNQKKTELLSTEVRKATGRGECRGRSGISSEHIESEHLLDVHVEM